MTLLSAFYKYLNSSPFSLAQLLFIAFLSLMQGLGSSFEQGAFYSEISTRDFSCYFEQKTSFYRFKGEDRCLITRVICSLLFCSKNFISSLSFSNFKVNFERKTSFPHLNLRISMSYNESSL